MSDHVDGPRSIGDPAADLTDLFAFASPENAGRTVLGACVFPSAGEDAMFSNAVDYAIVLRRVSVAGVGNAAKFQPAEDELRFSFRFSVLTRDAAGSVIQTGVCTLPDGRELSLTVNDDRGASTADGDVRAFAGLRSDPFYLAWDVAALKRRPNLLQHTNVLCIVVEFDASRVLNTARGSLFGAIAETVPISQQRTLIGPPVLRIDWVGRPEQTNIRLNNPAMSGIADLRDLWNQQTPFAIAEELQPLFLQRLKDSLAIWDSLDGKADWTPDALAANASVFLDDFLLFDVAKPITDQSHLEIEKSTINGRPYRTGGGRTVDANSIDILLTWLVNHDREFLQGGAAGATKAGTTAFPYFATPNTELQTVVQSLELAASPGEVWLVIGDFGGAWHPLNARITVTGAGIGQLRTIETLDGQRIVERLDAIDNAQRVLRYTSIAGMPVSHYTGVLEVKPGGRGCIVEWRAQFMANRQTDRAVKALVSTLFKAGLDSLESRFGVAA
jgi:hypothetical protein